MDIDILFWKLYKRENPESRDNAGFIVDTYNSEKDLIASDFLDNHFYQTGLFHEKMRMYCEFRDTYNGDPEIIASLNAKIEDKKYFMYYEYYGTRGCSSRKYKEIELYRGWKNVTKEGQLEELISKTFKIGEKYSKFELKDLISKIYKSISLTKTAKATDLGQYFKLIGTKVTLPDGKIVNGFKLESL